MRIRSIVGCITLMVCAIASAQTTQPGATDESKFLRFVADDHGGGVLQASVITYRNAAGASVDLIAAVHIADASFFRELDRSFDAYDSVLYELIKPKDAVPGAGPASRSSATLRSLGWVGMLQRFMKDNLALTFQLEQINYSRKNFVHADLDTETFLQMQEARGESMLTLMLQQMLRELTSDKPQAQEASLLDLLAALQSQDRARALKLVLARQFSQMDDMLAGMDGPDGSVILTERNKTATRVLHQRLDAGDKKLAIFYGAAHLKGMEKIITEEMGFKQVGIPKWRTAWDMSGAPTTVPAAPGLREQP